MDEDLNVGDAVILNCNQDVELGFSKGLSCRVIAVDSIYVWICKAMGDDTTAIKVYWTSIDTPPYDFNGNLIKFGDSVLVPTGSVLKKGVITGIKGTCVTVLSDGRRYSRLPGFIVLA